MRSTAKRLAEAYLEGTSALRMRPDFLIIGAQRGGTTSLYRYLAAHPCVAPTLVSKGVHYFDVGHDRSEGWYRGHFPPTAYRSWRTAIGHGPLITGEASPYYLFHPLVPQRVAAALPEVRLIVMLRDPVRRAYSHYQHEVEGGYEDLPTFEAAIETEPERLAGEVERIEADPTYVSFAHQHHSYLARGRYPEQLRRWLASFPRDRFLIMTSEDFYRDTPSAFERVQDFLGLPRHPVEVSKTYNAHTYEPMSPGTGDRLRAHFHDDDRACSELIGHDPGWD